MKEYTLKTLSNWYSSNGELNIFIDAIMDLGLDDYDSVLSAEVTDAIEEWITTF